MSVDDSELEALLAGEEKAEALHRQAQFGRIARDLGELRKALMDNGFTWSGSEDICRDFGRALLELTLFSPDCSEDDE